MRYLIDANVLIDANRDYYALDRVPEFWDWLLHRAEQGMIAVPAEMFDEVVRGKGALVDWLKGNKAGLVLKEEADAELVRDVLARGYGLDLSEDEIGTIGNDPFIVAYARAAEGAATVVTTEATKPRAQRANRRLPDVCATFGVPCINTFTLVRELNFSTGWQAGQGAADG